MIMNPKGPCFVTFWLFGKYYVMSDKPKTGPIKAAEEKGEDNTFEIEALAKKMKKKNKKINIDIKDATP